MCQVILLYGYLEPNKHTRFLFYADYNTAWKPFFFAYNRRKISGKKFFLAIFSSVYAGLRDFGAYFLGFFEKWVLTNQQTNRIMQDVTTNQQTTVQARKKI